MTRQCGDCQLCCKLLPVRELSKGANQRCQHQRFGKGCAIYGSADMPLSCRLWTCRWLANDDADDLRRPDRAGYVIDVVPDFVRAVSNEDGSERQIEVVQIWCDPKQPEAYRDSDLLAWLERKARKGCLGLVRYDAKRAVLLWPPSMTGDGWHVWDANCSGEPEHSAAEVRAVLAKLDEPEVRA